jgi:hypothetical protein
VIQNLFLPFLLAFPLDLIGFFILAIVFLFYSKQKSKNRLYFAIAGVCNLGWIICRFLCQFIIPNRLFDPAIRGGFVIHGHIHFFSLKSYTLRIFLGSLGSQYYEAVLPPLYLPLMSFFYILGSLLLFTTAISLWFSDTDEWRKKKGHLIFLVYTLMNVFIIISLCLILFYAEVYLPFPGLPSEGLLLLLAKTFLIPWLGAAAFFGMSRKIEKAELN